MLPDADGNIAVKVGIPRVPLEPPDMLCYGAMPSAAEASCRDLLNQMTTRDVDVLFGPSSDPNAQVHTPLTIISGK